MQVRKKVIIASSIEPSGVTWLLNCLLYLEIMCYRDGAPEATWLIKDGNFCLKLEHEELKRWLPITSIKPSFNFSSSIECEWTHNLPGTNTSFDKVILFTRDPRGSILSRYRRDFKDLRIDDFIRLLDSRTLLTVPDRLNDFYLTWLNQKNVFLLKFEDYKINPYETLKKAVAFLELDLPENQLRMACENSTFEMAAKFERKYLADHDLQQERVMNRAGSSREWMIDSELISIKEVIENSCHESLIKLNYLDKPFTQVSPKNFFSKSVLSSVNIREVILQNHYNKEDKQKITHGISKLSYLPLGKRLVFAIFSLIIKVALVFEELIKVNYMRIKNLSR